MSTTFQIAEVAERSGFTPATLRYYEDIGLLTPADRTAAGYRLYDEASLERLRFIARAKQLGCSLDEIAELTTAWEGGRCADVQDRLRAQVATKVGQAHAQIAELTALVADLLRAGEVLSATPVDGPCDDTCGCIGDQPAPHGPAAVPLVAKAGAGPIACTLDQEDMPGRLTGWHAALSGVVARRRLDDGLRLELGPGADVGELARLAVAEQDCCRFFAFDLVVDGRGAALEVHVPPEAEPVLAGLFGTPD